MKPQLLERIQEMAHWRVLIRPVIALREELTFGKCLEVVTASKVSIRGWDYPHVERDRPDDRGGHGRGEDFYESWTDWEGFREFWRMYKSGQFLSYNLLHGEIGMFGDEGGKRIVPAVDAIYSVTEYVEFAQRLVKNVPLSAGYELTISLRNASGYRLISGSGRMPFLDKRVNGAKDLTVSKRVTPVESSGGTVEIANGILLSVFDYFGWNPSSNQIRIDQEAFFRREFR